METVLQGWQAWECCDNEFVEWLVEKHNKSSNGLVTLSQEQRIDEETQQVWWRLGKMVRIYQQLMEKQGGGDKSGVRVVVVGGAIAQNQMRCFNNVGEGNVALEQVDIAR